MYRYTPDDIDRARAHHQAVKQGADDVDGKRIGNLGELAFEQFCREFLPVEMWEWLNEEALRRCNPESFAGHDFEVFSYAVDVKTSRDVSAFLPEALIERDPDDDIVVMVWHRDNEDSLMLLGWERLATLTSKVESERAYAGDSPAKLDHLAARPMNELIDLGPNTAHMNQQPTNPFRPGDRVVRADDDDLSVGVVVEVLPPEKDANPFGGEMEGEAVRVAFPSSLDDGPGEWRTIDPALYASYCDDQQISLYTYKHTNLKHAENPFTPGDYVLKVDHDDPDTALVVESEPTESTVRVVYEGQLDDGDVAPVDLATHCEDADIKTYTYERDDLNYASPEA
ncbi:hypothetical protein [Halarchaeum sp. P4]|uniref:hypothetical protein n=1 Tax=Halarchaeum sp. P4 TaxID=3421639 RepID=UPI003EBE8B18